MVNKSGKYSPRRPKLKVPLLKTKQVGMPRFTPSKQLAAKKRAMTKPRFSRSLV